MRELKDMTPDNISSLGMNVPSYLKPTLQECGWKSRGSLELPNHREIFFVERQRPPSSCCESLSESLWQTADSISSCLISCLTCCSNQPVVPYDGMSCCQSDEDDLLYLAYFAVPHSTQKEVERRTIELPTQKFNSHFTDFKSSDRSSARVELTCWPMITETRAFAASEDMPPCPDHANRRDFKYNGISVITATDSELYKSQPIDIDSEASLDNTEEDSVLLWDLGSTIHTYFFAL